MRFGIALWGIICLICAPISAYVVYARYRDATASETWPTVQGRVIRSQVDVNNFRRTSYKADVAYEYRALGKNYRGNRITLFDHGDSSPGRSNEIVARFPVNSEATVYYNPDDPSYSLLLPGMAKGAAWFWAAPPVMLGLGILSLWVAWRMSRDAASTLV